MSAVEILAPVGFCVMLWWFATGVIWFLDQRAPGTFRLSFGLATVLAGGALPVLYLSARMQGVTSIYVAFSSAIVLWGWLEMGFLMGFITGPRRAACAAGCRGRAHFKHAVEAILYNELATAAAALVVVCLTWRASNLTALWTFLVLWSTRISAKLNLHLGVPNNGETFLPAHLEYLKSFFRRRRMNYLFPLSITAMSAALVLLIQECGDAAGAAGTTQFALLASLMGLALLEHLFMVISWPSDTLWKWAFRLREKTA